MFGSALIDLYTSCAIRSKHDFLQGSTTNAGYLKENCRKSIEIFVCIFRLIPASVLNFTNQWQDEEGQLPLNNNNNA